MSGGTEDGNRKMPIILLSPLLVGSFCQGWGEWKRARTQLQKEPCAHPALLSFWLICAKPFAKLSKLYFNHQYNDASIYLTSTCLRRAMSIFISYFGLPRQTQLTLNNRAYIWPGVHFISFKFNFSRIWQGLVFSRVCIKMPVLSVCIFLVILSPVCSSAHYCCSSFQGANLFFFYSVINVF